MSQVKGTLQKWVRGFVCIVSAAGISCGHGQGSVYVDSTLEDLHERGTQFDKTHISIFGCIRAHPHGVVIVECPSGDRRIPLEASDDDTASEIASMHSLALRAQVSFSPLPKVHVCGIFHVAPDAQGRWIAIESMSSNVSSDKARCRVKN